MSANEKRARRLSSSASSDSASDSESQLSSSDGDENSEKCPICLRSFTEDKQIAFPIDCERHIFCLFCLEQWAKNVTTCPIDRKEFAEILVCDNYQTRNVLRVIAVEPRKEPSGAGAEAAEEDETFCEICHASDREETMLLCDGCDRGYHMECLTPSLEEVPQGAWYCDHCFESEESSVEEDIDGVMEEAREMAGDAPLTRRQTRAQRVIRTRQSERILASIIEQAAAHVAASIPSNPQPGPSRVVRRRFVARRPTRKRRRVTRRRKRTTRRKPAAEYDVNSGDEKFPIAKKERKVRRRKYRKRAGVSRRSRATAAGNAEAGESSSGVQRSFKNAAPKFRLFEPANQLDFFSSGEDEAELGGERVDDGSGDVAVAGMRAIRFSHSRALSRKIAPSLDIANESCNLLDMIMETQSRFHSKQGLKNAVVDAAGKIKFNNNDIEQAPRTPGGGAGGNFNFFPMGSVQSQPPQTNNSTGFNSAPPPLTTGTPSGASSASAAGGNGSNNSEWTDGNHQTCPDEEPKKTPFKTKAARKFNMFDGEGEEEQQQQQATTTTPSFPALSAPPALPPMLASEFPDLAAPPALPPMLASEFPDLAGSLATPQAEEEEDEEKEEDRYSPGQETESDMDVERPGEENDCPNFSVYSTESVNFNSNSAPPPLPEPPAIEEGVDLVQEGDDDEDEGGTLQKEASKKSSDQELRLHDSDVEDWTTSNDKTETETEGATEINQPDEKERSLTPCLDEVDHDEANAAESEVCSVLGTEAISDSEDDEVVAVELPVEAATSTTVLKTPAKSSSSFKKVLSKKSDRNYRDKDAHSRSRSRSRSNEKENKRKKRSKKGEIARYDVRNVLGKHGNKDRYHSRSTSRGPGGRRSFSISRSRSPFSHSPTPRKSRSRSRRRSPTPRRRYSSRSRSRSPRRRSITPKRRRRRSSTPPRRRSLSPRRRSRKRTSRSRSKNRRRSKKRRKRSSRRSLSRSIDRLLKTFSKEAAQQKKPRKKRKERTPPPRSPPVEPRNKGPVNPRAPRNPSPPTERLRHYIQTWTPPREDSGNLQVTVDNKDRPSATTSSKKKSKKRKATSKKKDKSSKQKERRRHERGTAESSAASKEIFASGENILVSVSFNSGNAGGATTERQVNHEMPPPRVPLDPETKKRRKVDVKPVAFIDLDGSPTEIAATSPIIITSDGEQDKDGKDGAGKKADSTAEPPAIDNGPTMDECLMRQPSPPESPSIDDQTAFAQTGPKTPPELPPAAVKFSMGPPKSKPLRPVYAAFDEHAAAAAEDKKQADSATPPRIGPNTPPEPTPSSPDAYDPFEPTKSPSPSTSPRSPSPRSGLDDTSSNMAMLPDTTSDMPAPSAPTAAAFNPVDLVMSLIKGGNAVGQSDKPESSTTAEERATTNGTEKQINVLSNVVVAPSSQAASMSSLGQHQTPAKSTLKSPMGAAAFSSLFKRSPAKPPASSSIISKLPLPPIVSASGGGGGKKDIGQIDSPYSPGSSDFDDLFEPPGGGGGGGDGRPSKPGRAGPAKSELFDALFGTSPKKALKMRSRKKGHSKPGRLSAENLKLLDEVPSSAVELQAKDKLIRKLNRQERVIEEVKLVIKPYYFKKQITKEEYKDIMRKAVPKICHSRTGEINPQKIKTLIEAYVKKARHQRKAQQLGLPFQQPTPKKNPTII